MNGQPSIGIFVRKQSDANVVDTASRVKEELAALQAATASRDPARRGKRCHHCSSTPPWTRRG